MLESKFIKGTNKQYSIRNDGTVISHYKTYKNQYSSGIIVREAIVTPCGKYVYLNKSYKINSQTLLYDYFGFKHCCQCSNSFFPKDKKRIKCDNCKKENSRIYCTKWAKENPLKKNISKSNSSQKIREDITKSYAAKITKISVKDMTDELYLAVKTNVLLKRKIKIINT